MFDKPLYLQYGCVKRLQSNGSEPAFRFEKNGRDLWLNPDVRIMWMDKWLSLVPGNIQSEQTISDSYTAEKSTTGIQAVLSEKQNKNKTKTAAIPKTNQL